MPCGNVEAYTTTNWGGFSNFVELCEGEISVTANPVEGGTVTGGGFYGNGMAFTLTATANPGYTFINWTKDGVGVFNSATYQFYVAGDASYVANFAQGTTITFADANVKNLCVANWDTDGDGKLSYAEAAMVTDLGTVFINKSNITSFNELQYFVGLKSIRKSAFHYCSNMTSIVIPTSVTSIGNSAFRGCSSMTSIVIPSSVKSIGNDAFCYCNGLTSIIVLADTPPSLSSSSFYNVNKGIPVYVPCGCVEAYQSVPYWNQFTNIQENCTQSQTINLSADWNWFSTYIEPTNPIEMLQTLEEALGENGLQIKSNSLSTEYDSVWGWFGDLEEVGITVGEMLMIETSAECTFELQGEQANPANHPITITPGWNWIGYPCAVEMTLEEAFSNFIPEAGDQIKNSEGSSEYDSEWGWFGNVETLMPGQGFMYYSSSAMAKTLVFQVGRK